MTAPGSPDDPQRQDVVDDRASDRATAASDRATDRATAASDRATDRATAATDRATAAADRASDATERATDRATAASDRTADASSRASADQVTVQRLTRFRKFALIALVVVTLLNAALVWATLNYGESQRRIIRTCVDQKGNTSYRHVVARLVEVNRRAGLDTEQRRLATIRVLEDGLAEAGPTPSCP